ncbi:MULTISPECIES: N-methyl-L-tryptophan oxidase [Pseudofrankia]|uniref:N-methyl-L-tryptophan oxidase n=1 Tax=Pseudofrankia TaxID=2994363 RepID=UPI000488F080|nr:MULTISPECIES: N-methyl-L-tryptophan oxidase [Pseudofrankia]
MESYDVIVAGLGGMGSSAAHHLAARGQRVLGLERFGPAHDQGASHGGSRITRQSYFEDPAYVPLLLRAYELWDKLARDSGRELITLTGGLMTGLPDSLTVAGSRRSAQEWGLEHEMLDAAEIRRRFPMFRPRPDEVALYEAKAGLVRPEATVAANLTLAAGLGAELRFHEPVAEWSADDGGVTVRTGTGTYHAGALVVCPGPWASRLLADLGLPLVVERHVQFWFAPRGGIEPFRPDRQPIYIWERPAGTQVYGFPALDGPDGGVKVAFFRRGEATTPDTIDRRIRPDEVEVMATHLAERLPDAAGRLLRGKACMYTNTPDEHFVIAPHPAHDRVTIACGFSGHGFKFVPVVGEILADLALTGATSHPITLFDPARPALKARR